MGFGKFFKRAMGFTPFTGFGAVNQMFTHGGSDNPAGAVMGTAGVNTPAMRGDAKDATDKANSAADAAIKQAEFEASAKAGLERLALRRRKGFAASMIVDPGSSLGTSSTLGA